MYHNDGRYLPNFTLINIGAEKLQMFVNLLGKVYLRVFIKKTAQLVDTNA